MPTHLERLSRTGAKNLPHGGLLQQAKFILKRAVRVEIYGIISDESETWGRPTDLWMAFL